MDFETLDWRTFPELLEDNGISWKVYQNEISMDTGFEGEEDAWLSNFTDNNLEFHKQYHIRLHRRHLDFLERMAASLPAEIEALRKKLDALPTGDPATENDRRLFAEKEKKWKALQEEMKTNNRAAWEKLSEREKDIHRKAFTTNEGDPDFHRLEELTYSDNGTERSMLVPKGDVLYQFRQDVNNGSLPTVSWLVAPQHFSDHPSSPWYGAWYVSEVLDILTRNPEVWKKTIFILTYDENDGYFDHVPPFVAPHSHKPGTGKVSEGIDTRTEFVTLEQEKERKGFPSAYDRESAVGLGYRVPLVIASPWSRGGFVNSQVFDHTSSLRLLEAFVSKKTGRPVMETNISSWRRTVCGDLSSAFRPYNGEPVPEPEFLSRNEVLESIHQAQFKKLPSDYKLLSPDAVARMREDLYSSPDMPRQEKGIRPSCALPYELYADGGLAADKKHFGIRFAAASEVFGSAASGSPFQVYAPGKYRMRNDPARFESVRTWSYAVKAGDRLEDRWPLAGFEQEQYWLRVYGPNGFFREFRGDAGDPLLDMACRYASAAGSKKALTGNISLRLRNLAPVPYTIEIRDNAYKTGSVKKILGKAGTASDRQVILLELSGSHQWYDFSVRVQGFERFGKRYAGRVETGRPGFSDPFMGGML
jgi:phospholipase C